MTVQFLCAILLSLPAAFQEPAEVRPGTQPVAELRLALPAESDPPGFKVNRDDTEFGSSMWAARIVNGLRIDIWMAVKASPEEAAQYPVERNKGLASPDGEVKKVRLHPGIKAEQLWELTYSGNDDLVAIDGRCVIELTMTGQIGRDDRGRPGIAPLTSSDAAFARLLLAGTLERATVVGLTSRPAASASSVAKRQVEERRKAEEAERAVNAPFEVNPAPDPDAWKGIDLANLPPIRDIPGFQKRMDRPQRVASVTMAGRRLGQFAMYQSTLTRSGDGLQVTLSVTLASNQDVADRLVRRTLNGPSRPPFAPGSPSGRRIGDGVWQVSYPRDNPRTFRLMIRKGRGVATLNVTQPVVGPTGGAVSTGLQPADVLFAEALAEKIVNRLAGLEPPHADGDGCDRDL